LQTDRQLLSEFLVYKTEDARLADSTTSKNWGKIGHLPIRLTTLCGKYELVEGTASCVSVRRQLLEQKALIEIQVDDCMYLCDGVTLSYCISLYVIKLSKADWNL
jgi:hypothetical protein